MPATPPAPVLTSVKTGNAFAFESTTCTRCGGSGHYSYCQSHGTRCFKCGGHGITLTKRGAAAQAFFTDLLTVNAEAVAPGQKILNAGIPGFAASGWALVDAVTVDGDRVKIDATMPNGDGYGLTAFVGSPIRLAHSAEAKAAAKAEARAYQATLTKAGTPRKR